MAPPVRMAPAPALEAAAVSTSIIHGWDDELIPAPQVVDWAQARRARLLLADDSHRPSGNAGASAEAFDPPTAGPWLGGPSHARAAPATLVPATRTPTPRGSGA